MDINININKDYDFWYEFHESKKKPVCVSIRESMLPRLEALKIQNFSLSFILEIGIEVIEKNLKERESVR